MKKLPIDVSTFRIMIDNNYVYVDKTEHIYNIITKGRYYFLSRPRRFGKSLLISTLKEIFLGNKALFDGLWIGKSDYAWDEHPIIHLNFSDLDIENPQELKISLAWRLDQIAEDYGIDISEAPSPGLKLELLIKKLAQGNNVAVLIDEYDYPLINNLDNTSIAHANRKVLKNFFSVLKSLDPYLTAIFITGVTKFSKTSIFSGLNNLNDLTIDPGAATLLGYTSDEIDRYFPEYIHLFAQHNSVTDIAIKEEMKSWYNGYRFSESTAKVYNPFSVLYYLSKEKRANYWFESGTPGFLIELLKKQSSSLEDLDQVEFSEASLGTFDLDKLPLITVLFQTGYLTICDYDPVTQKYKLGYPNAEINESFRKYLLVAFSQTDLPTVDRVTSQLTNALKSNNIPLFCMTLQSLLANIPYQLHIAQERYYHSLFQLIACMLGFEVQSEVSTDKGRIDLVFITHDYIYIFELKFNADAATALHQIEELKYYEKYLITRKTIILVGISFNYVKNKLVLDFDAKELAVPYFKK